jgi:uncharacterized cupredoxin-like copper-binding protein
MRRLATIASFAIVAAAVVGCGSSSSGGSKNAAAAQSSSGRGDGLTLSESEFKISPANATVAKAGTVTITVKNTGAITHALSIQMPSGTVSTSHIAPGATATLTVNAMMPGKYVFFCPIPGHRQAGMQGVLVVGSASTSAGASTPSPYAPKKYQVTGY